MSAVHAPSRPGSVTAAGVILYAEACAAVLAIGGVYMAASLIGGGDQRPPLTASGLFLAVAVVSGALGYFTMKGRPWARTAVIALSVIGIIAGCVLLLGVRVVANPAPGQRAVALVGSDRDAGDALLLFNGLLVWLLNTGPAPRYFRHAR
jgi:hypothetical protein